MAITLMKNKLTLKTLSRWVAVPLLVAILVAWGVSPAYPSNVVSSVAQAQQPNVKIKAAADNSGDMQDIKDRIKELESKERQNYTLMLDDQRKKIDWWFSFLAVLTAVMAIAGGLIPFLMARKDKELIEQDKAQVSQMKDDVSKLLTDATSDAEKIHQHEVSAAASAAKMQSYKSDPEGKTDEAKNRDIVATVNAVREDKTADPILRLRAEAIAASEARDAEKAYALWNALTLLNPEDAVAESNANVSAGLVSDSKLNNEKIHWLRLAQRHGKKALGLNPKDDVVAYNLGNALLHEANAVVDADLPRAKELWNDAIEKFRLTLSINPRNANAAHNWGVILDNQAIVFAKLNALANARELWRESVKQYQCALNIEPTKAEAASNWGGVLAHEAIVTRPTDIKAAKLLFKQSIEKFELALQMKPEYENAANHLKAARAELKKLDEESK